MLSVSAASACLSSVATSADGPTTMKWRRQQDKSVRRDQVAIGGEALDWFRGGYNRGNELSQSTIRDQGRKGGIPSVGRDRGFVVTSSERLRARPPVGVRGSHLWKAVPPKTVARRRVFYGACAGMAAPRCGS